VSGFAGRLADRQVNLATEQIIAEFPFGSDELCAGILLDVCSDSELTALAGDDLKQVLLQVVQQVRAGR